MYIIWLISTGVGRIQYLQISLHFIILRATKNNLIMNILDLITMYIYVCVCGFMVRRWNNL